MKEYSFDDISVTFLSLLFNVWAYDYELIYDWALGAH